MRTRTPVPSVPLPVRRATPEGVIIELPPMLEGHEPRRIMFRRGQKSQHVVIRTATVAADGTITIEFPGPPAIAAFHGKVCVTTSNLVGWNVLLDRSVVDTTLATNDAGPFTQLPGQTLDMASSGLVPGDVYSAAFVGIVTDPDSVPQIPAPSADTITEIPLTVEFDYTGQPGGSTNPTYLGTAPVGTPQSSALWTVRFFQYDGSQRVTSITTAKGAWTQRATLTYG